MSIFDDAGESEPRTLVLYYGAKSICSSFVRLVIAEKGLEADLRHVDLYELEHLTVWFSLLSSASFSRAHIVCYLLILCAG